MEKFLKRRNGTMVKVKITGTDEEVQKTMDYFNKLEQLGEILVHKVDVSVKKEKTIRYLYIQVNNEANDILKQITATN